MDELLISKKFTIKLYYYNYQFLFSYPIPSRPVQPHPPVNKPPQVIQFSISTSNPELVLEEPRVLQKSRTFFGLCKNPFGCVPTVLN